jgi:diguanylate cyclase (GGDEF)-like protein
VARAHSGERPSGAKWERTPPGVVVPIGVIVTVAIVCIVVAVLSSARRADEVALNTERELFHRALTSRAEWTLRKIANVIEAEDADGDGLGMSDADWIQQRLGPWLKRFIGDDMVFVADAGDRLVYALAGDHAVAAKWSNAVLPDLAILLDHLRGRSGMALTGAARLAGDPPSPERDIPTRTSLLQPVLGHHAMISGTVVGRDGAAPADVRATAPVIVTVQFVDAELIGDIGKRLQLKNLRSVGNIPVPSDDTVFELPDDAGEMVARFAWTPPQPGAQILESVIPFIAVAFGGFAVLVGLVLSYMRRTAATIAAGESRLRHLALHDPLCTLPNRIFFGERLEQVIDRVRAGGPTAAVFYIDLDHFKEVNDTLGHPVGDELIRNVATRLGRAMRGDDLVARLGGDEFAVITTTSVESGVLQAIASRMIEALCAPYSIGGHTIVIGASIGIAVIDRRARGAADIMRYADMALYRAKNEGRNRACIYDAVMDADLSNRKLLEHDLRRAIENDGLHLLYQPLVNNSGERMVGVEALCRWNHPERGEIPPSEFIPVAEHSGLIIDLGEWVLRRACLDGKGWPGLTVAVNVSPLQFRRGDFVDVVERILAETGFEPTRLELEVTESTLLGNVETAEAAMRRLKALGVRLALDDFGTGYSSLLYLRTFPFDKLKIDSSFVRSIEKAADAAAIVHAVVSLGRGLGMKVTAEGVETAEQHLFLRAAGVHSMQGYRFGRPLRAAEISVRLITPQSFRLNDSDVAAVARAG